MRKETNCDVVFCSFHKQDTRDSSSCDATIEQDMVTIVENNIRAYVVRVLIVLCALTTIDLHRSTIRRDNLRRCYHTIYNENVHN
jgi:hypothetical protein